MTHQPTPCLSEDLTLDCLDRRGRLLQLPASLDYSPADPFAVALTFRAADEEVPWLLARSLLHGGLTGPAGRGDVRVRPSDDGPTRAVAVELRSPCGRLTALLPADVVVGFLERSYALVPPGAESSHLDLDALVAGLLDGSEAA